MTREIIFGAVFSFNKRIYSLLIPEALSKCALLIVKMLKALLTKVGSFLD
jgi:hypothetical protein